MDKQEQTTDRLKAEMDRGKHAQELLNDSLLNSILGIMKAHVISNLSNHDLTKEKEVQLLNQELQVINKFESTLKRMIEGGDIAESRLQKLIKQIKR